MTDWPATLIPLGSLIVGSLLTMGHQALADRRTERREREARIENFKIQNFEVHRDALLKTQSNVAEFSAQLIAEKLRRKEAGDYAYFDAQPMERAATAWQNLEDAVGDINSRLADHQEQLEGELKRDIEQDIRKLEPLTKKTQETTASLLENFSTNLAARQPFLDSYTRFILDLRMATYRSGSNSVVGAGQDYIRAILHWDQQITTEEAEVSWGRLKDCEYRLHRAVSNALTKGPYDKYEHPDDLDDT